MTFEKEEDYQTGAPEPFTIILLTLFVIPSF